MAAMSATRPPKFAGPTFRHRKPASVTESIEEGAAGAAGPWARKTLDEAEMTIARAARARTGIRGMEHSGESGFEHTVQCASRHYSRAGPVFPADSGVATQLLQNAELGRPLRGLAGNQIVEHFADAGASHHALLRDEQRCEP